MSLYGENRLNYRQTDEIYRALRGLIEDNLPLSRNNFRLVFEKFKAAHNIRIIYESSQVRVRFMFAIQRTPRQDELSTSYGRLHAPDEEPFMIWNQESCRCWHDLIMPLLFLDGLTPEAAIRHLKVEKKLPAVMAQFRESQEGRDLLREYPPLSSLVMHQTIWRLYGRRLFDLFDLKHDRLWDEYRNFLKRYHALLGRKQIYGPPDENVC